MRRYLAGMLLVLMAAQSSGAALAQTSGSSSPNSVTGLIGAITAFIVQSKVYSQLTGEGGRYDAIHAPPPRLHQSEGRIDGPALMRSRHVLWPVYRSGTPELLRLPPPEALTARHRPLDPRAMGQPTAPSRPSLEGPNAGAGPFAPQPLESLKGNQGAGAPRSHSLRRSHRLISSSVGTGIEHWWTYQERAIPGLGEALFNVGTGNLMVTTADVNVPEQGINLVFQRVYNSQSLHDANGDDGGEPAIFGNGWTNNFDSNIVYNSTAKTITVYDLNGTACTYTSTGSGEWTPCTGEYATLAPVQGSDDCTYTWTKPSGVVYVFASDGGGSCSGKNLAGHLVEILGRNISNFVTFTYSYDSSGKKTSEHVTQIKVDHSDGDQLVLTFGVLKGTSINELATVTRPDQAELKYSYDQSGNLLEVDKPGNNSAATLPNNPDGPNPPQGDLPETYAYNSGGYKMAEACGPRCTAAMWANPNNPKDGSSLVFAFDSSGQLSQWQVQGVLNFTPDDQTSTPLQSGPATGWQNWNTAYIQYGALTGACGTSETGETFMCDEDGHATIWTTDLSGRVTQTQQWVVDYSQQTQQWVTSSQTWDALNNSISSTDPNDNITKYGYDSNGNNVETLLPNANDFTIGGSPSQSLSPLSFYSYDAYNNLVAYCDPFWTQKHNKSWVTNPGDSLCPSSPGTAYFVYHNGTEQPYGCLTDMYKPGTYHTAITYTGNNCGVGLPTKVLGDTITQFGNNSSRQPTQDLTYGQYGQITATDLGTAGSYTLDSLTLGYNPSGNHDNLPTRRTENDPTISGNNISSFTCYYPNASVFYTETPSQHAADGSPSCPSTTSLLQGSYSPPAQATVHYYDFDGNDTESVGYQGCSSNNSCSGTNTAKTICSSKETQDPIGTTCRYYDGLDRLVEAAQPYDDRYFGNSSTSEAKYEFNKFRWMNRYIFDLSLSDGNATLTIGDSTGTTSKFPAYGHLYKTQEYLPQLNKMVGCLHTTKRCSQAGPYGSPSWSDVRGASYDGLDRLVSKYELAYGTGAVTTNMYDGSGQAGQLSATTNAVQQTITYSYDPIGRMLRAKFSGTAPQGDNRTFSYDPDGRTASVTGDSFGMISYTYDVDGNKLSTTEPLDSSGYTGGSLICVAYYPDGLREYLSIGNANLGMGNCSGITPIAHPANGGISQPNIFSYAYTRDGRLSEQDVNWGNNTEKFSWTYKPSGREISETDPFTGQQAWFPPPQTSKDYATLLAKSYTYDTYGRVSGLTLPGRFQESDLIYDEEDELAGYTAEEVGGGSGVTRTITLNARGEILQDANSQGETHSANGVQVGDGDYAVGQNAWQLPPSTLEYDLRSDMATCSSDPNYAQDYSSQTVYPYVTTYDAAGRQTGSGFDSDGNGNTNCDPAKASGVSTYDADNHIHSSAIYKAGGTAIWGPDGRQRITDKSGDSTAHWDGDTLLFATGGSETPQLYIGKLGVMDYAGDVDVYDRDQSGAEVSSHGQAVTNPPWWMQGGYWYDGWSAGSVRTVQVYKTGKQYVIQFFTGSCNLYYGQSEQWYACPADNATYEMKRADGYSMVGGIVQGVRTFDPTSGQWTTPDPYAGSVTDPMSQKPFIWNGNNPVEGSDPTGYVTYVGDAWMYGIPDSLANTVHAFVEVIQQGGTQTFEYGPQFMLGYLELGPVTLLQVGYFADIVYQDYGSTISSPQKQQPTQLPPINGISGTALDNLAISTFNSVTSYLASHDVNYSQYNSNSVIAAGLLMMGYSPQQVSKWVIGPGAGGGNPTAQGEQLESLILGAMNPENIGYAASFITNADEANDFLHEGEEWTY
jgi:YD repeat-containing protein